MAPISIRLLENAVQRDPEVRGAVRFVDADTTEYPRVCLTIEHELQSETKVKALSKRLSDQTGLRVTLAATT